MPVDIGGIVLGILGIILGIYYLIWFLFVVLSRLGHGRETSLSNEENQDDFSELESSIYRSETGTIYKKNTKIGCGFVLSFFMPFILIIGFLIYILISSEIKNYFDRKVSAKNNNIIHQEMIFREKYFKEACEKESKILVYKKIPLNAGFYTDSDYYKDSRKNQLYEDVKSEIDQCKMMMEKQNKNTGAKIMEGKYCYHKYASLIQFVNNFDFFRGGGLIKYTKASFFEYIDYCDNNTKKVLVDGVPIKRYIKGEENHPHVYYDDHGHAIDSSKVFNRYATKAWWMHSGLGDIVMQWMHRYIDSMHVENIHDEDFVDDEIPVTQLLAHYRLDVEDISTLTDRHRGIRRGRIRLVDRSNQQLLSEYITFDIMDFYSRDTRVISSRSCLNQHLPRNEIERTYGNPEIFEYFFKHALDETQTMPLQKVDRL